MGVSGVVGGMGLIGLMGLTAGDEIILLYSK